MKKLLAVKFAVLLFFIALPLFAQESPLKTTLYFPHWTDGEGWRNRFQFTNLLWTHSGKATLRFYNHFGNEVNVETDKGVTPLTMNLAPGGAITISTLGRGASGSTQGLAVVEADIRIAGKIEYHYPAFRIRTAVPPSPTRRAFTIFANYLKHPVNWKNTGIALANPQDRPSYVDLALIDEGGTKVAQKRVTLGPRGHIAELLDWTAFFPEYFSSHDQFHGTIAIVAERPIAILALEFEGRSDGTFLMDNGSPLPPRYLDTAEISKHSIQVVYFVPKDSVLDSDYVSGIRFVAEEVLDWYDIELQRAGQQDLASLLDFVKGSSGKVSVGLVNGRENLAVYADFNSPAPRGLSGMGAELKAVYPNQYLLVAIQGNGNGGFALGGGDIAMFTVGQASIFPYPFRNFNEDYLRNGDPACPSCIVDYMARWLIADAVFTAAHEVGHAFPNLLGMISHSNRLDDYFPGKYINLMYNRPKADLERGWSFFASSLMPDVPFDGSLINVALDGEEINTLIH